MKLGERAREKRASEGEIESTHELDGEREGDGGREKGRASVRVHLLWPAARSQLSWPAGPLGQLSTGPVGRGAQGQ